MDAPIWPLRTERLDLRPFEPGDLDAVRAQLTDPSTVRYLYTDVLDEAALAARLDDLQKRATLEREGDSMHLVGVLRETGEVVGDVVLIWVSEVHRSGEVGYVLVPRQEGLGYATEMSAEMLRVAFDDLGLHRVVGRLDARNTASAAVLERLGMRREAELVENEWVKGEWASEVVYAVLASEWQTRCGAVDKTAAGTTGPA